MITSKDNRIKNLGRKLLKLSFHSKYKMIALLVKGGNIISVGANKEGAPKPYVKCHRPEMGLHAEVSCLAGITKDQSKNTTIYVVGQTTKGNNMLTKPCKSCYSFIKEMGIRRVVYETSSGELEELID